MTPAARTAVARQAAVRRWTRARFGRASFQELGLPGGELVDVGLADLAAGRETVASLVVSEAAPRLRREGVPVPRIAVSDAAARLYRALDREGSVLAHARFSAHLRQVASFADACRALRTKEHPHA